MKSSKYILIALIFSGLIFVSAAPNSSDESINQFVEQFVKRWNRHDPKDLIELWAENGDLMNPAGEWEKGKSNVLKILVREHQSVLRESQMKQEITNIIPINSTMAWVDANVTLNVPGIPSTIDHHIVYLLVKENNQWRILAARPYQFLELHLGLFESPHAKAP